MIKLGVLGSTNGTDLQTILDSIASGELNGEVSVVLSNRKNAYILERAKNHNVPAFFNSHKEKSREEFDDEVTAILKEHTVDLVLLIGFMRILSAKFCQDWQDRLLNVHPSLLPKYAGGMDTNVHADAGPILIQKKCNVQPDETVDTLKTKVQKLEGMAFIEAIQLIQNNSYVR